MNKSQIIIAVILFFLIGAGYLFDKASNWFKDDPIENTVKKREPKNGEVKQFTTSGKLKTIVNYDHGIKHGISYLYHEDGETVFLAMPYERGKREGISKKYFTSGEIYAETSYENDRLHGFRKLYFQSGQLKAIIDYGYGFPGIGIQEYFTNGTMKESNAIQTNRNDNYLYLSTKTPCKNSKFFIGKLLEDKYLDELDENVQLLPEISGEFYVDLGVYTPSYLKYQDIICSCKSKQGNPVVMKRRLNL